jgi:hypothetical protein
VLPRFFHDDATQCSAVLLRAHGSAQWRRGKAAFTSAFHHTDGLALRDIAVYEVWRRFHGLCVYSDATASVRTWDPLPQVYVSAQTYSVYCCVWSKGGALWRAVAQQPSIRRGVELNRTDFASGLGVPPAHCCLALLRAVSEYVGYAMLYPCEQTGEVAPFCHPDRVEAHCSSSLSVHLPFRNVGTPAAVAAMAIQVMAYTHLMAEKRADSFLCLVYDHEIVR